MIPQVQWEGAGTPPLHRKDAKMWWPSFIAICAILFELGFCSILCFHLSLPQHLVKMSRRRSRSYVLVVWGGGPVSEVVRNHGSREWEKGDQKTLRHLRDL